MVLPLGAGGGGGGAGGIGMMADDEVPDTVKSSHSIWWRVYMLLLLSLCVARFCALDILGAMVTGIMSFLIHHLVKDNCEKMTQCIILLFGFMCQMNFILEAVVLAPMLGGRSEQSMSDRHFANGKTSYTVTIQKHPFFDSTQHAFYNLQSFVMVASPFLNLIGVLLAYWSYNAYPRSVFEEPEDHGFANPGFAGGGFAGGANGGGYGGGGPNLQQRQHGGGYGGGGPNLQQGQYGNAAGYGNTGGGGGDGHRRNSAGGGGASGGAGNTGPPDGGNIIGQRMFTGTGQRLGS